MYMLQLAKEHQADSQAAAERGRLVREVRQARQHHGEGLWTIAAARDLRRRLWGGTLVHSPKRDLGVAEAAAVDVPTPGTWPDQEARRSSSTPLLPTWAWPRAR
jgi:hypothetical protein